MGTMKIYHVLEVLIVLMALTSTFDVVTSEMISLSDFRPAFGGGKTKQRAPVYDILVNAKKIDTKYHPDIHPERLKKEQSTTEEKKNSSKTINCHPRMLSNGRIGGVNTRTPAAAFKVQTTFFRNHEDVARYCSSYCTDGSDVCI
ncbi:unnamed protein product [Meganyctiphanes norvegica]|uniref:Secreted protein n=1 Tax=Meganyctiphanes norvegica TaxID=48144 RepID=A0AAV2QPK7_MEGNR